jgi:hypothetical protein
MASVDTILEYIPDSYSFNRMQDMQESFDQEMNYADFLEWNRKCLLELDNDDLAWVVGFCKRVYMINSTDMESCVEFEIDGFYYNKDKKFCIHTVR